MTSNSVDQTSRSGVMCLELALEGERLCKLGDCRAGVAFFQAALQAGTKDLRTLSAIYSQLGNAYFYLGDYSKAMDYHKHDLALARMMKDKLGEAKSSGNLGNAFKVMGQFDEAIICCKRHLEISTELDDKLSRSRALYNLGNIYHAKGKHIGRLDEQEPGGYPPEINQCFEEAIKYYEENLALMKELGDVAAQGRAYGNLGNTNYLLGNFLQAIYYHNERLKIALQFNDKSAERRANSNLGNSHIFIGEFKKAAEYYKRMLELAQELQDKAVEAQAYYSLGNTYMLLNEHKVASEYHLQHYFIAKQLGDRVGEGRACWSLGNAFSAMGDTQKALYYSKKHLEISEELGDTLGQATARSNVINLQKALGILNYANDDVNVLKPVFDYNNQNCSSVSLCRDRLRRKSMEQLNLIKLTPEKKNSDLKITADDSSPTPQLFESEKSVVDEVKKDENEDELFFDLLSEFQSKRMDDQRCSLYNSEKSNEPSLNNQIKHIGNPQDDLMDLIIGIQSRRMDEQRAELPILPGYKSSTTNNRSHKGQLDKKIIELLKGKRLSNADEFPMTDQNSQQSKKRAVTLPDEDFFALITNLQSGRMDDQRATLKGNE